MRQSLLFLAGCYGPAGCLWAEPIYNYTATSGSVTAFGAGPSDTTAIVYTNTTIVSSPGFSLNVGGSGGDSLNRYFAGQQIPPTQLLFIENGSATVDYGGFTGGASIGAGLEGSAQLTLSENPFIIPPNPTSYALPARITGQFTASAGVLNGCGTDSRPPCDASAVLSIDLPGTLTISFVPVSPVPGAPYLLNATFASVPEPSSVRLWLLGAGMGGTVWLARRGKAGRSSC